MRAAALRVCMLARLGAGELEKKKPPEGGLLGESHTQGREGKWLRGTPLCNSFSALSVAPVPNFL